MGSQPLAVKPSGPGCLVSMLLSTAACPTLCGTALGFRLSAGPSVVSPWLEETAVIILRVHLSFSSF